MAGGNGIRQGIGDLLIKARRHDIRTEYVSRVKEYAQTLDELMRSDLPGEKSENDR